MLLPIYATTSLNARAEDGSIEVSTEATKRVKICTSPDGQFLDEDFECFRNQSDTQVCEPVHVPRYDNSCTIPVTLGDKDITIDVVRQSESVDATRDSAKVNEVDYLLIDRGTPICSRGSFKSVANRKVTFTCDSEDQAREVAGHIREGKVGLRMKLNGPGIRLSSVECAKKVKTEIITLADAQVTPMGNTPYFSAQIRSTIRQQLNGRTIDECIVDQEALANVRSVFAEFAPDWMRHIQPDQMSPEEIPFGKCSLATGGVTCDGGDLRPARIYFAQDWLAPDEIRSRLSESWTRTSEHVDSVVQQDSDSLWENDSFVSRERYKDKVQRDLQQINIKNRVQGNLVGVVEGASELDASYLNDTYNRLETSSRTESREQTKTHYKQALLQAYKRALEQEHKVTTDVRDGNILELRTIDLIQHEDLKKSIETAYERRYGVKVKVWWERTHDYYSLDTKKSRDLEILKKTIEDISGQIDKFKEWESNPEIYERAPAADDRDRREQCLQKKNQVQLNRQLREAGSEVDTSVGKCDLPIPELRRIAPEVKLGPCEEPVQFYRITTKTAGSNVHRSAGTDEAVTAIVTGGQCPRGQIRWVRGEMNTKGVNDFEPENAPSVEKCKGKGKKKVCTYTQPRTMESTFRSPSPATLGDLRSATVTLELMEFDDKPGLDSWKFEWIQVASEDGSRCWQFLPHPDDPRGSWIGDGDFPRSREIHGKHGRPCPGWAGERR